MSFSMSESKGDISKTEGKISNNERDRLLPPKGSVSANKTGLRRWIYEHRIYALVFIIPLVIMYIVYAVFKVHPWGDNSVLVLDLNGQYVYYYEALRDAFWGKASFIYSWNRNLSGEMFGIFAYYLLSPFMLIICILPRTMMCGAIEIIQLLKIGTAAVTFAFFIRKSYKPKNVTTVIFSTCYALMTYMVVELMDPMWLDGLIYLPLICWGVVKLIDNGKALYLIIPLALMFIAHFYIGYMVGLFTALYFLYYLFTTNTKQSIKSVLTNILKFAGSAVVAVMLACVVLIPVYKSLSLGKLQFSTPDFSLKSQFNMINFFTKLFPMSYDTVRPEGLPMVFCGTLTLILTPLFFLNRRIALKQKAGLGALAAVLLVSMYLAPVDIAWHGFQIPNWLPYRYSFAFSFILLLMAVRTFDNLDGVSIKAVGGTVFALICLLAYYETIDLSSFTSVAEKTLDDGTVKNQMGGIWFSAVMLVLYFVLLLLLKKKNRKIVSFIITGVVFAELYIVSYDTIKKVDKDVAYSKYTTYENYMTDIRGIVDDIKKEDKSFYRMEKTFDRTVCDPMGIGYAGISHSSSTMNTKALLFLNKLGYGYGGNFTSYNGSTYVNDSLLGVKYLIDKDDDLWSAYCGTRIENVPVKYDKVRDFYASDESGSGTVTQYQNPYALSIGFQADSSVCDLKLENSNPFENQNAVFNSITANSTETQTKAILTPLNYTIEEYYNVESEPYGDNLTRYYNTAEEGTESHIDYLIDIESDGPVYVYFPTTYEKSCNLWYYNEEDFQSYKNQNGSEPAMDYAGSYFEGDNYRIVDLGEYKKGSVIRLRITLDKEAFWSEELFYTIDNTAFEEKVNSIKQNELEITEYTDRSLKGNIQISGQNKVMLTTIPYEEGWKITVDGKKTEPVCAIDSLTAIRLDEGSHKIEMTFMPDYFIVSVVISIIGLLICVVIFAFEFKDGLIKGKIIKKFSKAK